MRKTHLIAAGLATAALAIAPAANAASGSGSSSLTGTVVSAIAVTPTALVPMTGFGAGGAGHTATGSSTVTVVSTDQYCLSVNDQSGNNGKMKGATSSALTANAVQWKATGTGVTSGSSFQSLGATLAAITGARPNSLLDTYTVNFQLDQSTDNLPADAYTGSATFSAQTC